MAEKEKDRDETYKAQTTEQYAALGQFIQEFGQICKWLQTSFVILLQGQGLRKQTIANIIIGNRAITTTPRGWTFGPNNGGYNLAVSRG